MSLYIYIYIYVSFNDADRSRDYVVSTRKIISE
jgi:hypothetical protein